MNKYTYIPSYTFKTGSKYKQLTEEYNELLKDIKEGKITPKKNEKFFIGMKHISDYIYNGFFYNVSQNYDSKSNFEKVITSMYLRLKKFYGINFENKFHKQIFDLAEISIFYSLGIEKYKNKKSFTWEKNKNGFYENFIKHTSDKVFRVLIYDFFKKEISCLNIDTNNLLLIENKEEELSSTELIELSGYSDFIPEDIKSKIISYLESDTKENIKEIEEYLKLIFEALKDKDIL
jgi:hypothetical protein